MTHLALVVFKAVMHMALAASLYVVCHLIGVWRGWPDWPAPAATAGVLAVTYLIGRARHPHPSPHHTRAVLGRKPLEPDSPTSEFESDWQAGLAFIHSRGRSLRTLPWFLSLSLDGHAGRRVLKTVQTAGRDPEEGRRNLTWHFTDGGIWINPDWAMRSDSGEVWNLFVSRLTDHTRTGCFGGVVYTLDARRVATSGTRELHDEANRLGALLDSLSRTTGCRPPLYILVDGIDGFYGMKSLLESCPDTLAESNLGTFVTGLQLVPAEQVMATMSMAAERLTGIARLQELSRPATHSHPASLQAVNEFLRLGKPLSHFCSRLFRQTPYHIASQFRGLFFGASDADGCTIPSLLERHPSFRPVREPRPSGTAWFWSTLLERDIPLDPVPEYDPVVGRGGMRQTLGLASFLAGTLVLSVVATFSFLESHHVVRKAGEAVVPVDAEGLTHYLSSTLEVAERNAAWPLPRLGLNEPLAVERLMREQYCESFRLHKGLGSLEQIYRQALATAKSGQARDIGKALATTGLMRVGLTRKDSSESADSEPAFMAMPDEERRLLVNFLRWNGDDEWTASALRAFERAEHYIVTASMDGEALGWLPEWVESSPAIEPVDTAQVWYPAAVPAGEVAKRVVRAAWTAEGYFLAKELLDRVYGEDDAHQAAIKNSILATYRREALKGWHGPVRELWRGYHDFIGEKDVPVLLDQTSRLDGPPFRLIRLMLRHLLPMFPAEDRHPEVEWLRRYSALMAQSPEPQNVKAREEAVPGVTTASFEFNRDRVPSAPLDWKRLARSTGSLAARTATMRQNLDLIRYGFRQAEGAQTEYTGSLLGDARVAAYRLNQHLGVDASNGPWANLTPVATYNFLRYLLVRAAAMHLETAWQEQVYQPALFIADGPVGTMLELVKSGGKLEKFLTSTTVGLWTIHTGRLENASWDGLSFMFNQEFLDYCNWALEYSQNRHITDAALRVHVDSMSVNPAALEKPVSTRLRWRTAGKEFAIESRNYTASGEIRWQRGDDVVVELTISFPSHTVVKLFAGKEVAKLVRQLHTHGYFTLRPEDFPLHRETLEKLRVGDLTLRARLDNVETFLRLVEMDVLVPPATITTPIGGQRTGDRAPVPKVAPESSGSPVTFAALPL